MGLLLQNGIRSNLDMHTVEASYASAKDGRLHTISLHSLEETLLLLLLPRLPFLLTLELLLLQALRQQQQLASQDLSWPLPQREPEHQ